MWGLGDGDTGNLPGAPQSLIAMGAPRHPLLPAMEWDTSACMGDLPDVLGWALGET